MTTTAFQFAIVQLQAMWSWGAKVAVIPLCYNLRSLGSQRVVQTDSSAAALCSKDSDFQGICCLPVLPTHEDGHLYACRMPTTLSCRCRA